MTQRSPTRFPLVSLALAVGLGLFHWVACDSAGPSSGRDDSERASFRVRLTDAPGDIVQAIVTIERVATDRADVTLDFSVDESFVKAGQSGTFIFMPVVQAPSVVTSETVGN